jgi:uncharacterized protein YlaI
VVRTFDSDDVARGAAVLSFTERVDCPACDTIFDATFQDDSLTVEDISEAPTATHVCPACRHTFTTAMTGWMWFGEAG